MTRFTTRGRHRRQRGTYMTRRLHGSLLAGVVLIVTAALLGGAA